MADSPIPEFDTSTFNTDSYVRRVEKPWGYELHWVPEGQPYMGKVIHINPHKRLSQQIHDQKQESYFLINGSGMVIWDNEKGEEVITELQYGVGYSTKIGQKHRLCAGENGCDIIEVSTPEAGTTWRLQDDYARPDQTPEERDAEYARNARIGDS